MNTAKYKYIHRISASESANQQKHEEFQEYCYMLAIPLMKSPPILF